MEVGEAEGAQTATVAPPVYAPSPELAAVLDPLVASAHIDDAAFNESLGPLLQALPRRASRDARAIVDVYFRSAIAIDPAPREAIKKLIGLWGYRLDDATTAAAAIATNVTELDYDFGAVCARVRACDTGAITLGLIDGGFEVGHPALAGRFVANARETAGNGIDDDQNGFADDVFGWNFQYNVADLADEGAIPMGRVAHGTHVAGVAARGTEHIGLVGTSAGSGQSIEKAIDYLAGRGARVISFSLGLWSDLDRVLAAIDRHPEIVFFESAGNDGKELGVDPSRLPENDLASNSRPHFAKVAAADPDLKRQATSNFSGTLVQLAAVGPVYSAFSGGYVYTGKTSQSTPAVANLASRVRLLAPSLGPTQVIDLLIKTSDQLPAWQGLVVARGLVNNLRAERVAAALTLMAGGADFAAALDSLGVPAADRPPIQAVVTQFAH